VFADLAGTMLEASLADAIAAWPPGIDVATGLAAALLAKDLGLFRLLAASPHGAEILSEGTAMTMELHASVEARFRALLVNRLVAAGITDAPALARMIAKAADGIKHAGGSEADYVADITRLAALVGGA
jgi:hypothetical protein